MTEIKSEAVKLFCDFCGKHQDFVGQIVVGKKAAICNECVDYIHAGGK